MKTIKNRYPFVSIAIILLLLSFALASCSLIEGIGGIFKGFQPAESGTERTVSSEEIPVPGNTVEINDPETHNSETGIRSGTAGDDPGQKEEQPYVVTPADKKGMKSKVETGDYIFYFNDVDKEFLNTYVKIAEDGNKGLIKIFGKDLDNKLEIFLCESLEEFEMAAGGISPPGFDGSEPAGQSVDGVVHMYKAEEFKPGPGDIDEILSYRIALLHEIGHSYYFMVYPGAAKKNDWLNEALADKSITGEYIDPVSISNDLTKNLISSGSFIPVSELESMGKRTSGQDENLIFPEYISFVNFICLKFGFGSLNLFLSEYNGSKDLLNSLEAAVKLDPGSFEDQWRDAIKNGPSF